MSEQERRYKVMYIDENVMIAVMAALTDHAGGTLSLPVFRGLPKGYDVRAIHYEFQTRAFAVTISHESFPIVPTGTLCKGIETSMETRTFDLELIKKWAKEHPNG